MTKADEYLLKKGDILFTRTGASVGKTYHYNCTDGKVYYAGFLIKASIKPEYNSEFVFQNTLTEKYDKFIQITSQRSGQPGINAEEYGTFQISVPPFKEQHKVATFFKYIDTLIALHQRKLDQLKRLKQGFLQILFGNKEQAPKVRFAGFDEEWEHRKLGEVAEIVRGASPRPIQDSKWFDSNSDIGWLRISDVTEQNGRIYNLEQRISEAGQQKTRVLETPHLLLSIAATVGKPVMNYVKTGVHDGFLIFLHPKFNTEFVFQWLEMFRPQWQKYGQPGSQVNLNSELVRNQEVSLPSMEEQDKVAHFFEEIDTTIALHQTKLEKLKQLKKAFLQKMFI